jgi:phosphatidylglycerol:prolipoprotein diacylglycerol transferase
MANVPEGGIVLYGAFLGGLGAALVFFAARKLPALAIADIIIPGMVIGASLGRVGCFLNGCCFGGLCTSELPSVQFPVNSPPYVHQLQNGWLQGIRFTTSDGQIVVREVEPGSAAARGGLRPGDQIVAFTAEDGKERPISTSADLHAALVRFPQPRLKLASGQTRVLPFIPPPVSLPVHPAQLYDALNLALLTLVLWLYYPLRRHDGEVLALGMIFYSITRFVLEIIRVDEPSQLGTGLSISQLISFGVFAAGVAILVVNEIRRRPPALPWNDQPSLASAP